MPYLMTDKEGLEGTVVDTAVGGIAGAAGRYVYDKFVGNTLVSHLGSLGKYADVGGSFLYGLVLDYLGARSERYGKYLAVAAYVPVADAIARALGDPAVSMTATSHGSPWGKIQAIPLTQGTELRY